MTFSLLKPAILLTQRLRLLPKFMVLTAIFLLPLVLASSLLLNELSRSIVTTRQERIGISQVKAMQELIWLAQQNRAYQHMYIMGNKGAESKAQQARKALDEKITAFDKMHAAEKSQDADGEWKNIKADWRSLQNKLATIKDRKIYNDQTAFIAGLKRYLTAIADRSNLTHDPEVSSYYLAELFINELPKITNNLTEIAGRGAAYIDSGLMEANEEILLGSTTLIVRHDLATVAGTLATLWREDPKLKPQMQAFADAEKAVAGYLDRTKNEVLNSVDQTSGDRFFAAGAASVAQLYRAAATSAELLDARLQARIAHDTARRNTILGVILATLMLAAYFLLGFYASFSFQVRRLHDAVRRVSAGDLSHAVDSDGRDEMAQLLNAFGGMNAKLSTLVAQVRNGSDTIALASQEIAAGNQHLSSRTEEQAGSLEQTAAAMEQLTTTVRQNTDNAMMGNQLAQSASGVAQQGGIAVAKVVDTMAAIRQSANEINDIIGVVDSIAFQTNILALNAAVEAARAGEAGKGFAVVAAEVRNLAQRSATAAKDIKSRIKDSVEKVEAGSKQVDQAGNTMNEIVASIDHVRHIVQEIAAASHEQQSGIDHINQAMAQMDQITQQNAALVEQAAAATDSMRAQTARLSNTVAVFKLAGGMPAIDGIDAQAHGSGGHHDNVMPMVKRVPVVSVRKERQRSDKPPRLWVANGSDQEWETF
jgi:methyl-accepting chemotaxis protein